MQGHRSGHPSCVLVDIEVVVEMGNARPFDGAFWIDDEKGPMVFAKQIGIDLVEEGWSQRLALLSELVNLHLELGKERLPNDRPPDPLDLVVEQIRFFSL